MRARDPIRRASSASSQASTIALSSSRESTWDGDEVVASEPADYLLLDAALLVRTLIPAAIEGFDAVVGTDGGSTHGLDSLAGEPDRPRRRPRGCRSGSSRVGTPPSTLKWIDLEEGFLPSRGTDPVHGLARVGEPKAEQRTGQLAAQADGDVAEVNLGPRPGRCSCGDERVGRFLSDLDANLAASVATYSRTIQYDTTPAPSCSSSSRSKIRFAVSLLQAARRGPSAASRRSPLGTRQAVSRAAVAFSFGHADSSAAVTVRSRRRACAAARGWTSQIGHPAGSPRTGRPGNAAASSVALLT